MASRLFEHKFFSFLLLSVSRVVSSVFITADGHKQIYRREQPVGEILFDSFHSDDSLGRHEKRKKKNVPSRYKQLPNRRDRRMTGYRRMTWFASLISCWDEEEEEAPAKKHELSHIVVSLCSCWTIQLPSPATIRIEQRRKPQTTNSRNDSSNGQHFWYSYILTSSSSWPFVFVYISISPNCWDMISYLFILFGSRVRIWRTIWSTQWKRRTCLEETSGITTLLSTVLPIESKMFLFFFQERKYL